MAVHPRLKGPAGRVISSWVGVLIFSSVGRFFAQNGNVCQAGYAHTRTSSLSPSYVLLRLLCTSDRRVYIVLEASQTCIRTYWLAGWGRATQLAPIDPTFLQAMYLLRQHAGERAR